MGSLLLLQGFITIIREGKQVCLFKPSLIQGLSAGDYNSSYLRPHINNFYPDFWTVFVLNLNPYPNQWHDIRIKHCIF